MRNVPALWMSSPLSQAGFVSPALGFLSVQLLQQFTLVVDRLSPDSTVVIRRICCSYKAFRSRNSRASSARSAALASPCHDAQELLQQHTSAWSMIWSICPSPCAVRRP